MLLWERTSVPPVIQCAKGYLMVQKKQNDIVSPMIVAPSSGSSFMREAAARTA